MTMEPEDLERQAQRAFAALPTPRAPRTLRPRVLAAVSAPPVGHPWFTWPWPAQVATLVVVVGAAFGLAWAWPLLIASVIGTLPASVQTGASYASGLADAGGDVWRVLQLTWSSVVAPLARIVLLLTLVLCTACALCLAAFSRVALGGASQS